MLEERTLAGLHASLIPHVQALRELSPESQILDLACGTGAWLNRLNSLGYRNLTGIDQDNEQFQAGRAAHHYCVNFNEWDWTQAVRDRRFDLITAIEIIEHVANPERFIELACQLLVPGGWLLITTPNIYSIRARLRFLIQGRLPFFEPSLSNRPVEPDHLHPLVLEAYRRKIFDRLPLKCASIWTFPERGSDGSRWFVKPVIGLLRLALPEQFRGDCLCLLFQKA